MKSLCVTLLAALLVHFVEAQSCPEIKQCLNSKDQLCDRTKEICAPCMFEGPDEILSCFSVLRSTQACPFEKSVIAYCPENLNGQVVPSESPNVPPNVPPSESPTGGETPSVDPIVNNSTDTTTEESKDGVPAKSNKADTAEDKGDTSYVLWIGIVAGSLFVMLLGFMLAVRLRKQHQQNIRNEINGFHNVEDDEDHLAVDYQPDRAIQTNDMLTSFDSLVSNGRSNSRADTMFATTIWKKENDTEPSSVASTIISEGSSAREDTFHFTPPLDQTSTEHPTFKL